PRKPKQPSLCNHDTRTAATLNFHGAQDNLTLRVNEAKRLVDLKPRVSLLDALREHLELTSSKKGCDQGTCDACTMWVDKRHVLTCLTLAVTCEGHEVTT